MLQGVMRLGGLLCKVHDLRIADLNAVCSSKTKIILAMNDRLFFSDMSVSQSQRNSAFQKVFRCGPKHDVDGHEMAAHVDKPRKAEAAGVLDHPMGKVPRRLRQRLHQGGG